MPATPWNIDNTYVRLPERFFSRVRPTPVRDPAFAVFNAPLARQLGLDAPGLEANGAPLFAGNVLPPGADPIAQAYAGHQFGHFTILGDGRAILLGEHVTPDQKRLDIQLKGSGATPYSRRGDGRAALGPMLREYVISEAMFALGVPTTRSLAVVSTGEPVYREKILDGAVLTRVAASHIRVGTFEYAATLGKDEVRSIADYTISRHYPELIHADNPHQELLAAVIGRQASLMALWLKFGFIHGVMNTDNMAVSGETIDYGPCAFMDRYDPDTVFSSIDRQGRYAFKNQARIAEWNLTRFAETLLPLLAAKPDAAISLAQKILDSFKPKFEANWLHAMRAKLGLFEPQPEDQDLVADLLTWMHVRRHDYTSTFRTLSFEIQADHRFLQDETFVAWHKRWLDRVGRQMQGLVKSRELMQANNPAYIARNHLVEQALAAATEQGDMSPLHEITKAFSEPFREQPGKSRLAEPPETVDESYRTFCGT